MKKYRGGAAYVHTFLKKALGEGDWSNSSLGCLNSGERKSRSSEIRDSVGPRLSLISSKETRCLPLSATEPQSSASSAVTMPTTLLAAAVRSDCVADASLLELRVLRIGK